MTQSDIEEKNETRAVIATLKDDIRHLIIEMESCKDENRLYDIEEEINSLRWQIEEHESTLY